MRTAQRWGAVACAMSLVTSAHAHHAMGNATPSNLFEGFVSGLAHPVIGVDHLLFVLAVGVAAYCFRRALTTAGAFVAATLVGTVVHLTAATLPYAETAVAASLVLGGLLLIAAARMHASRAAIAFFALAGVAHGYAYGEAIVGAEMTPLAAYLAGFTLIQLVLVAAAYALARTLERRATWLPPAQAFGAAVSIAGVAFLAMSFAQ